MNSPLKLRTLPTAGLVDLLAGLRLYPFLIWSPQQLTSHGLLRDDAFFYSVIVRNFNALGVVTFDGVMPTNGFQPLWMGLQIILARLLPSVDEVTLLARTSWFCYVGFSFFLIPMVCLGWIVFRTGLFSRQTMGGCLLLLIMVGPYLLYNQLAFNGMMPISGRIKMYFLQMVTPTFPDYFFSNQWLGWSIAFVNIFHLKTLSPNGFSAVILATSLIAAGGILVIINRKNPAFPLGLKLLTIVIFGHLMVMQFFFRVLPGMIAYYFLPEVLWFVLLLVWFTVRHAPNWLVAGSGRSTFVKSRSVIVGLLRLWERRESIVTRAERLLSENGNGWYLLELIDEGYPADGGANFRTTSDILLKFRD